MWTATGAHTETFNQAGQMIRRKDPNGCSVINVYDERGRLTDVISNEGVTPFRRQDRRRHRCSWGIAFAVAKVAKWNGTSPNATSPGPGGVMKYMRIPEGSTLTIKKKATFLEDAQCVSSEGTAEFFSLR